MAASRWHTGDPGDAVGSQVLVVVVFGLKELLTAGEVMDSELYLNCRGNWVPPVTRVREHRFADPKPSLATAIFFDTRPPIAAMGA